MVKRYVAFLLAAIILLLPMMTALSEYCSTASHFTTGLIAINECIQGEGNVSFLLNIDAPTDIVIYSTGCEVSIRGSTEEKQHLEVGLYSVCIRSEGAFSVLIADEADIGEEDSLGVLLDRMQEGTVLPSDIPGAVEDGMGASLASVTTPSDIYEMLPEQAADVFSAPDAMTSLTVASEGNTVHLSFDAAACIPDDAEFVVQVLDPMSEEWVHYTDTALSAVPGPSQILALYDLSIMLAGEDIEPQAPVMVTVDFGGSLPRDATLYAVHFPETESDAMTRPMHAPSLAPSALNTRTQQATSPRIETIRADYDGAGSATFVASSFSVFAIVYTVDFHWEVNGKTVEFSIPGGGFTTLDHVVEMLGIAEAEAVTAQDFVSNITDARFSDESLIRIIHVTDDITALALKEKLGIDISYSSDLTDAEIAENLAQRFVAPSWVLVSLLPFDSEEILTVTMKNGDVWTVRVTDVQIRRSVLSADGEAYEITVTYDEKTGIPEKADLEVNEILPEGNGDGGTSSVHGKSYAEYVAYTEHALGVEEGSTGYIRLFDIKIVDQDDHSLKYQPAAGTTVDVRIELADAEKGKDLSVVHFAGENAQGEIVDAEIDGQTVRFEAAGFSVYAITDESRVVVTPRAIYHFLTREGENQDSVVETQIIKNNETLSEVPVSTGENEAFIGWYIWENNSWGDKVEFDTPIAVSFADEERSLSSTQVILTSENNDVYLRPRYSNRFASVRFLRADESTIEANTQTILNTVKIGMEEGQSSVTYTLPDKDAQPVETAVQSYEFVGWSMEPPALEGGKYQYYSASDHRATIEKLSLQNNETVNLYPVFKQAHWITFKSAPTGSGATYYSPAWVENGQTAVSKKPAEDPTWNGYRFKYWTMTPTFDEETGAVRSFEEGNEPEPFDFSKKLTEDVTLYGYWESGITTYTVVTWKQVVTDDKDASPENRHYEFAGQEILEGKVGDIVNLTDEDTQQEFTGFHHKTEQNTDGDTHVDSKDVAIASGGTTVLNVYYDRDLMTMQFYNNGNGTGPTNGYSDEVWTKESPYVMKYTGLYGQSLQQNGYSWPTGTWTYYQNPEDISDTSGMSYLGQFVFPNKEIGSYFRAYNTGTSTRSIDFFLQNPDGSFPDTRTDYGVVSSAGQFNFTDKYDGYTVLQYRRYRINANGSRTYYDANGKAVTGENAESAWASASIGESTELAIYLTNNTASSYDGWYYTYNGNHFTYTGYRYAYDSYWGYYQTNSTTGTLYTQSYSNIGRLRIYKSLFLNLEIRYARKPYNIIFIDPTDNTPIAATMNNGSTSTSVSVLYGADVTSYYPSSDFVPQSKKDGVVFNGRWYSDSAQTIQIFFHEKGNETLTEAEEALLWYYVDASGEKYYTGYVPTETQLSGSIDRTYGKDQATVITEMPMHDLPIYPGWAKQWHWIKIDPNGGELLDGASTWFWETYGGDKVQEYDITRTYIQDDSGSYYYHYDEFNTADPNGAQPGTRLAYYTTDSSAASDVTKRYRQASSAEEYIFVGWYQVNSDDSLTPYNFDSEITGNLTLRAIWAQTGDYKVRYSLANAVDINGNALPDITVTGAVPVDTYHYAENANAMVKSGDDPVGRMADGTTKIFLGWMVEGGNDVLKAGDLFKIDPAMAQDVDNADGLELKDTLILIPVFGDEDQEISTSDRTTLILDMNGGTTNLSTADSFTVNPERTQIAYSERQINAAIVLPLLKTGDTDNFTKSNSEFLGWAFSPNAKTPEFFAGQTVGIDNLVGQGYTGDEVNTLYAVWHQNQIQIKVIKIDGTSENQNRIVLKDAQFTLTERGMETGDAYTSNGEGWLEKDGSKSITLFTPEEVNGESAYSLTETSAPEGYILPEEDEATITVTVDYDGNVTYVQPGRFGGATQTAEKDTDGLYRLEVSNEPAPINVTLKKVGVNNLNPEATETPLSGATFTIYEADGKDIVQCGGKEQSGLQSGNEGVFFNGSLKPGKYYLEETDTPAGYNSPLGRFELTVSRDVGWTKVIGSWIFGDQNQIQGTVSGNADKGYTITVRNVAGVALPSTGGSGSGAVYLLGILLTILSVAGLVMKRRRRA